MLHIFIDTNVLLDFYSFSSDDLEELRKVRAAVEAGQVKLWTTAQARDELARNRENKIAEAIKALQDLKLRTKAPQIARNMAEYDDLMAARREYDTRLNRLQEELAQQFEGQTLAADTVLKELMEVATTISVTDDIFERARRRHQSGNPPGKRDSMGDAINWECLLDGLPEGTDVYIISADGDFASPLEKEKIARFLGDEWKQARSVQGTPASAVLFRRISAFFREHFPDIELASELEKQLRIKSLVESISFEATHRAIYRLSGYDPSEFSEEQVQDLLEGAMWNSQIRWIAQDSDVASFHHSLLDAHASRLEPPDVARFRQVFFGEDTNEADNDRTPIDDDPDTRGSAHRHRPPRTCD